MIINTNTQLQTNKSITYDIFIASDLEELCSFNKHIYSTIIRGIVLPHIKFSIIRSNSILGWSLRDY